MAFQPIPPASPVVANERRDSGPIWNTIVAAVVGLFVIAYVAVTAAQLIVLNQAANDLTTIAAGGPGLAPDDVTTLVNRIHTVSDAYQGTFWAMFLTFFIWNAVLRSRLGALGQTFSRRSMTAWKVWRVGMLVSIVMIFVAQSGSDPGDAAAAASFYHRQMAFYAVRLLVGVAYLWVTYSVWRAAGAAFATAGRAPQAGSLTLPPYPQQAPYGMQAPYGQQPPSGPQSPWATPSPYGQPIAYPPPPHTAPAPYVPPSPYAPPAATPAEGTTPGL